MWREEINTNKNIKTAVLCPRNTVELGKRVQVSAKILFNSQNWIRFLWTLTTVLKYTELVLSAMPVYCQIPATYSEVQTRISGENLSWGLLHRCKCFNLSFRKLVILHKSSLSFLFSLRRHHKKDMDIQRSQLYEEEILSNPTQP